MPKVACIKQAIPQICPTHGEPHIESGLAGQVTYGIHMCAYHVAQVTYILLNQVVYRVANEQYWRIQPVPW